jgi:hypothetical protein
MRFCMQNAVVKIAAGDNRARGRRTSPTSEVDVRPVLYSVGKAGLEAVTLLQLLGSHSWIAVILYERLQAVDRLVPLRGNLIARREEGADDA